MTVFEGLPTTPRSEELVDKAFSRAARAGRAKHGVDAQESMLQTAANILSDNLANVVMDWPNFDDLDPFYRDLVDAIVSRQGLGIDVLRQHLSEVMWASRKCEQIKNEYHGRIRDADPETARKLRKQAFARLADVTREVSDDLSAISDAREELKTLPDIRPDEPVIVVAGYPNVGKSSFVNTVSHADNKVATYPFTTTQIRVGHVTRDRVRYQLVDTPGLLDRPSEDRNAIEAQAVSALTHLADAVLFLIDPSESCGYPLAAQLTLRNEIEDRFEVPIVTVCNKSDLSRNVDADRYVSVKEKRGVDDALDAAVAAVNWDPDLPFEEN